MPEIHPKFSRKYNICFMVFAVFDLIKKIINLKISFRLTYLSLKISIFLIKSFPSEIKNEI